MLKDTHELLYIIAGPSTLGFLVRRQRVLGACINRRRLIWTGPRDAASMQAEFIQKFGSVVVASGMHFMRATPDEVSSWEAKRARSRKATLPNDYRRCPQTEYLHKLIPPSAMEHKIEYEHLMARSGGNDPFFCDLDHYCGRGPAPGTMFPTALTHNTVFCFRTGENMMHSRLAVTGECLASQGLDIYTSASGGRPLSPLRDILLGLPDVAARRLVGNAMHIPSSALWMAYVFGNCRKVQDAFALPFEPQAHVTDLDSDNEDCEDAQ